MPTTDPARGFVTYVARQIGRSPSAVRKYIKQNQETPDVLGLELTDSGVTLDVEKTRAYADSRPQGRPAGDLIDQGISRLQLLAFLRGEASDAWNGSGTSQWVRYRGHQIDRHENPDGWFVQLAYTDHDDRTSAVEFQVRLTSDAVRAHRTIDLIIDAAIAHHGPDGVA